MGKPEMMCGGTQVRFKLESAGVVRKIEEGQLEEFHVRRQMARMRTQSESAASGQNQLVYT